MNLFTPPVEQILKRPIEPFQYRHDVCRDTGIVVARLKDGTPGEYAARCWCPKGLYSRRRFPLWDAIVGTGLYDLVDG